MVKHIMLIIGACWNFLSHNKPCQKPQKRFERVLTWLQAHFPVHISDSFGIEWITNLRIQKRQLLDVFWNLCRRHIKPIEKWNQLTAQECPVVKQKFNSEIQVAQSAFYMLGPWKQNSHLKPQSVDKKNSVHSITLDYRNQHCTLEHWKFSMVIVWIVEPCWFGLEHKELFSIQFLPKQTGNNELFNPAVHICA